MRYELSFVGAPTDLVAGKGGTEGQSRGKACTVEYVARMKSVCAAQKQFILDKQGQTS